jgi:hypothetical protein
MQTRRPIPEFLCFKYKGVKRVDQIQASTVPFAWKCRKYQNWKEIQNAPDDKKLLLKFAEALLDGGKLTLSDYGRISGIFFNVQRWRKDKEALAEEPDILPSWAELDSLLHVVASNPKVVVQKLEKDVPNFRQIPLGSMIEFFFGWALLEMLKSQKIPSLPPVDFRPHTDKATIDAQIKNLITFLYTSAGLSSPAVPGDAGVSVMISAAHKDLGFPAARFDYTFSNSDLADAHPPKTIVICYAQLPPLQIIRTKEIEQHIHLTINGDHDFVRDAVKDEKTKALLEAVLSAYAEALQQLPAQKDALEAVTSYLGIILKRRKHDKG